MREEAATVEPLTRRIGRSVGRNAAGGYAGSGGVMADRPSGIHPLRSSIRESHNRWLQLLSCLPDVIRHLLPQPELSAGAALRAEPGFQA